MKHSKAHPGFKSVQAKIAKHYGGHEEGRCDPRKRDAQGVQGCEEEESPLEAGQGKGEVTYGRYKAMMFRTQSASMKTFQAVASCAAMGPARSTKSRPTR